MVVSKGGFLGADLSAYGTNHEEAEIREAIVKPGKQQTISVTTRTGRKYFGLIRNEDNFSLQMQTPDGNFYFFEKRDLLRVERQPQPLMSETYETQLAKSELDDLVSYLMQPPGGK